jgi:hypothetical protein
LGILLLWALALVPAAGAAVRVIADRGVSDAARAEVQAGVEAALKYFDEVHGLRLRQDLRIILTPNREGYLARQMELTRGDSAEAERRADTTLGWNTADTILQNTGDLGSAQGRVYNIGHELAHSFQNQACAGECSGIAWLDEGSASAFGWQVAERCGLGSLSGHRRWALQQLKRNTNIAYLGMLRSTVDWNAGLAAFESDPVYHIAFLAAGELIRTRGEAAVMAYYRNLRNLSAEKAFEKAFGTSLPVFESQFDHALRNELAALPSR